jgi:hypothetical protein
MTQATWPGPSTSHSCHYTWSMAGTCIAVMCLVPFVMDPFVGRAVAGTVTWLWQLVCVDRGSWFEVTHEAAATGGKNAQPRKWSEHFVQSPRKSSLWILRSVEDKWEMIRVKEANKELSKVIGKDPLLSGVWRAGFCCKDNSKARRLWMFSAVEMSELACLSSRGVSILVCEDHNGSNIVKWFCRLSGWSLYSHINVATDWPL